MTLSVDCPILAFSVTGVDHHVAKWFHLHLTGALVQLLLSVSQAGSGVWIGIVVLAGVVHLARRRRWYGLLSLVLIVPGGLLLNEGIKLLVHRPRPFIHGAYVNWEGYSFPSGHAIGATLLYGTIFIALAPVLRTWHWRMLAAMGWAGMVLMIALSRIALGAHYLSDVVGAIILGVVWIALCRTVVEAVRQNRLQAAPDVVR